MAQEMLVGVRVDAKVTTKVTGENRSEWSHFDWEKSDDKEPDNVFKTYDTLEKPILLREAQRLNPDATFGRCLGIRNVQEVEITYTDML